jgi:hypothetical protein
VTASASDYENGSVTVTVTAGQTVTANMALQPVVTTGTISGIVTDASTGTPLAGASVSTQPATTTETTDAQGSYTISDVEPGAYTVTASASDYVDGNINVTVTVGETTTANLALQADYSGNWSGTTSQGKSISFTIVDNTITQLSFGFVVSGSGCTVSGTTTITYSPPKQISGNTFTISGSLQFGWPTTYMSYTFNGTFSSPTTSDGTANFTLTGGCAGSANATWSATRKM